MKSLRLLLVAFVFLSVPSSAQVILPLQQHKLLWADTVYREAIRKKDTTQLAEAWYLYGKTYEAAGDLSAARRYYMKSLAIIEPKGASVQLARLYNRLTANELQQGHYHESYRYAHLTLETAREVKSDRFVNAACGALREIHGQDWSNHGNKPGFPGPRPDSVRYYARLGRISNKGEIRDTLSRMQDTLYRIQMKVQLGLTQWDENRNAEGIARLKEALELTRKVKRKTDEMKIQIGLTEIYLQQRDMKSVEQHLKAAQKLLDEGPFVNSFPDRHHLARLFKEYYILQGNYKEALDYTEKVYALEKSRYLQDREGAISRLNVEYETEKKQLLLNAREEEIALKNANARMLRGFVILLGALSVVMLGVSILFYRLYKKNKRMSLQNEILIRESNHRVKNNLQSISSLLSLQSHELQDSKALNVINESRHRIESMSILHRKLYKDENAGYVFLPDFLEEITENVLSSYGFSSVLLHMEIDPIQLGADQAVHLGLIFNELVTNACKYAFGSHPEPELRVICKRENGDKIYFRLQDNGQYASLPAAGQGFGMQLIDVEVMQLYGEHHFSYLNGTIFTLTFPTNEYSNRRR